ncbi:MAG: imelysin family protein, partial [Natronospirillum sp.]
MAHHLLTLTPRQTRLCGLGGVLGLSLALGACSEPTSTETAAAPETIETITPRTETQDRLHATTRSAFIFTLALCEDAVAAFRASSADLNTYLNEFTASPSETALMESRTQWRSTLQAWGTALPCLALALPDASPNSHAIRLARTAAGPVLAGFIDSVPGYQESGLVHDENVVLTLDSLQRQHQVTDDGETSLGLFTLEVLLFGVVPRRSVDFAVWPTTTEQPEARRSTLLRLLASDLAQQGADWERYWQLNSAALVSDDISTRTAAEGLSLLLSSWRATLADAATVANAQAQSNPGIALNAEHDRVLLQGIQDALNQWWTANPVVALVQYHDISEPSWLAGQTPQLSAEMSTEHWRSAAAELAVATAQLSELMALLPTLQSTQNSL